MTHNTGWNTINKVNVTYFFQIPQGCGALVHFTLSMFVTCKRQKMMLEAKKDVILMRKCSSCLITSVSYIIGTGSKSGVLGGDKHKFNTIIWGGASPLPRSHCLQKIKKFKQTAQSVNKSAIRPKHSFLVLSHFSKFWPFSVAGFSATLVNFQSLCSWIFSRNRFILKRKHI